MSYTLKEIRLFWGAMQKRKKRELKELVYAVRLAVWGDEKALREFEKWLSEKS
ncbi:hypothetical protein JCM9492_11020 [Aquifex pyrophilus]